MSFFRPRIKLVRAISFVDVFLFFGIMLFIYALIGVAQQWSQPYQPKTEIHLGWPSLIRYSFLSLVRVSAAYFLSLVFTFTYGYVAAKSKRLEPFLIALLDILQSIPVLGFMPGLVLALVHLFPGSNLGLELAAVLMIFTGEGWNMVFSFYSSVKGVPTELREMVSSFRLSKWGVLRTVELPYAMNGLLWNSMLSMAGGWFFLMVIESFSLGDQNFRLPGIGSYMAVAYDRGDTTAIVAGLVAMCVLIFVVDRVVWAPLVVWSERFKYEKDARSRGELPSSLVLDLLKKSTLMERYFDLKESARKALTQYIEKRPKKKAKLRKAHTEKMLRALLYGTRFLFLVLGVAFALWGAKYMYALLGATPVSAWWLQLRNVLYTFLRVTVAVILGSCWTIPAGVFIGTNRKWTQRLQPVVQMVASFPAPMLFPILTLLMIRMGVGIEFGSIVLILFASQWYILFNVISGATLITQDLLELGMSFRLTGWRQWQAIILPAIFPSLVNGWITAAGGAWNASIVAEFVEQKGTPLIATGIGASITQAARLGDFPTLAAAIIVMVTVVVLLNRFFWGNLYRLAETRFRLE